MKHPECLLSVIVVFLKNPLELLNSFQIKLNRLAWDIGIHSCVRAVCNKF